jgi:hypothetical protein
VTVDGSCGTLSRVNPPHHPSSRPSDVASPLDRLIAMCGDPSDREIARRGGPQPVTIRNYRRGEVEPRPVVVRRLARALGLGVDLVDRVVRQTIAGARRRAAQR